VKCGGYATLPYQFGEALLPVQIDPEVVPARQERARNITLVAQFILKSIQLSRRIR